MTDLNKRFSAVQLRLGCGYLAFCRSSWRAKDEVRTCSQFYFILEGSCELHIDGEKHTLVPGDLALLPAGKTFSVFHTAERHLLKYYFEFSATVGGVSIFDWLPVTYVVRIEDIEKMRQTFHGIWYDEYGECDVEESRQNELVRTIFNTFMEKALKTDAEEKIEKAFLSVIEYMQNHMGEKLTVEELAAEACMAPTAFARAFQKTVGKPPITLLNEMRVEEAKRFLRETDMHVGEVGACVGFADEFNFSKFFSAHMGMAPSAYRREKGKHVDG